MLLFLAHRDIMY